MRDYRNEAYFLLCAGMLPTNLDIRKINFKLCEVNIVQLNLDELEPLRQTMIDIMGLVPIRKRRSPDSDIIDFKRPDEFKASFVKAWKAGRMSHAYYGHYGRICGASMQGTVMRNILLSQVNQNHKERLR